jgi:hypothetical protein
MEHVPPGATSVLDHSQPGTSQDESGTNGIDLLPPKGPAQSLKIKKVQSIGLGEASNLTSVTVRGDLVLEQDALAVSRDASTGHADNQNIGPATAESRSYNLVGRANKQDIALSHSTIWPQYVESYSKEVASLFKDIKRLTEKQKDAIALRIFIQQKRRRLAIYRERIHKWDSKLMPFHYQTLQGAAIDAAAFSKVYQKAENARNRNGPAEYEYDREEMELGKLEISIVDIGDRIQRNFERFQRNLNDDDHSDFETSSNSSTSTTSHISFQSDPAAMLVMNLPIVNGSEIGSIEDRDRHWRSPSPVAGQDVIQQDSAAISNFVSQSLTLARLTDAEYQDNVDLTNVNIPALVSELETNTVPEMMTELQKNTEPEMKPEPEVEIGPEMKIKPEIKPQLEMKTATDIDFIGVWDDAEEETVINVPFSISPRSVIANEGPFARNKASLPVDENPQSRVNHWLLEQLISSALEWLHYESELEFMFPQIKLMSQEFWQRDFLQFWNSDEAAKRIYFYSSTSASHLSNDGVNGVKGESVHSFSDFEIFNNRGRFIA